jgi:leader peptidase (prepilin peptidase) / N-methyltransferase
VKRSNQPSIAISLIPVVTALVLIGWYLVAAAPPEWLGAALAALIGLLLGEVVNLGVALLEFESSAVSPWLAAPAGLPRRGWRDRIPLLGWLFLRREAHVHGRGFWIRPLVVELLMGLGCFLLFRLEVVQGGLLPGVALPGPAPADQFPTANLLAATHWAWAAQMVLIALMATASLVDADEQIIPDEITVPGTLLGLFFATSYPWSLLPARGWTDAVGGWEIAPLHLAAPNPWPAVFGQWPGLALALACWWAWCLALTRTRWLGHHGFRRAIGLALWQVARDPMSRLAVIGTAVIVPLWWLVPTAHWAGLLSALVGMTVGGAIVWGVRIIGSAVLRQEAMGFGDVTLLAMIGAFLGWQACPLVFFLAPLAGVVIGIGQWLLHRRHEISYGPFLCLAALVVIVFWRAVWLEASLAYLFTWLVPVGLVGCLVMLGVLLRLWIWIRWAILGRDD